MGGWFHGRIESKLECDDSHGHGIDNRLRYRLFNTRMAAI